MRSAWKTLLIYTIFVILWGAFVRASGSGDGCGAHWPKCHGELLILSPNFETFVEYTHRATSGIYGIFVFVLCAFTFFSRKNQLATKLLALGVLLFTVLEALIGAKLVLSGLVGQNTSLARAVVMVIHLINTLFLVGCNVGVIGTWDRRFLLRLLDKKFLVKFLPPLTLFFFAGASGALAALGDTLYPSDSLIKGFSMDFNPDSPFIIKLRSLHPLFAFSLSALVIWYVDLKRKWGKFLLYSCLTTLVLGVLNLMLLAPLPLQIIHLGCVQAFWIFFCFYLFEHLVQNDSSQHKANS